jgi:hypothetical protein
VTDPEVPADALRVALDELALGGASWQALVARVAMAVARPVRLIAADGALLVEVASPASAGAAPPPASSPDHDRFDVPRRQVLSPDEVERVFAGAGPIDVTDVGGAALRALAVVAGDRRVGALAVEHPAAGCDDQLRAATTAIAIEAVRRDARAAAVAASAAHLIDELRFGSNRPDDELDRIARRYGIDLDAPHAAVGLDYAGPDLHTWATSLTWIESPVRADGRRAWSIVSGDVAHGIEWIQRRIQPFVRGEVRVASGSVVQGLRRTQQSFALADGALALLRRRGGPPTVTFDQLGLAGLLLMVPPAELATFVRHGLGPLLERPELLATLEAWYATSGSRAQVAEAVAIHRNSVGHRLERIRQLLGADPDAAGIAADLRAALAGREVLLARGEGELCSQHDGEAEA